MKQKIVVKVEVVDKCGLFEQRLVINKDNEADMIAYIKDRFQMSPIKANDSRAKRVKDEWIKRQAELRTEKYKNSKLITKQIEDFQPIPNSFLQENTTKVVDIENLDKTGTNNDPKHLRSNTTKKQLKVNQCLQDRPTVDRQKTKTPARSTSYTTSKYAKSKSIKRLRKTNIDLVAETFTVLADDVYYREWLLNDPLTKILSNMTKYRGISIAPQQ